MYIKDEIKLKIKQNRALRSALMDLHEVTEYTLLRWLRENSKPLIQLDSLTLIAAYLKININQLLINTNDKKLSEIV